MSESPQRRRKKPVEQEGPSLEQAGEAASEAQERARDLRSEVGQRVDRARALVADGLNWAASTLRSSAAGSDPRAQRFAEGLARGASYLREKDLSGMGRDVEGLVRQYPGQALGAAFLVGLLVGRRLARR